MKNIFFLFSDAVYQKNYNRSVLYVRSKKRTRFTRYKRRPPSTWYSFVFVISLCTRLSRTRHNTSNAETNRQVRVFKTITLTVQTGWFNTRSWHGFRSEPLDWKISRYTPPPRRLPRCHSGHVVYTEVVSSSKHCVIILLSLTT